MDLSLAHKFFASPFKCDRGFFFNAQLLSAPLEEASVYFLLPRRILKLDADSEARPGDVIRKGNNIWMCGENAPSYFGSQMIFKSFKLFEVTHPAASHKRSTKTTDAITGLEKKAVPVELAKIPVAIEFQKLQEDEMRVPADMVRIISAEMLLVGDQVNGYTITNVERQIGLYFSTAKVQ